MPAPAPQNPYLLLAGDLTPANVAGNIDYLETLPFDGVREGRPAAVEK